MKVMLESYVDDVVLMLISWNLHKKSGEVSIKNKSTLVSLSFIDKLTKHTTGTMVYCRLVSVFDTY